MKVQVRGEGNGRMVVPALASAAPYSSRLSARSALYTDLSILLGAAGGLLPSDEYRSLVMEENCLARPSTSARRKIWEQLKSRYILDAGHPLFAGFWTEWTKSVSEQEHGLTAYCLLALHDRLFADLSTELLFPLLRRAPTALAVGDIQAFLERSARAHPEVGDWSEQTKKALAQKYAASIRDFGLAKGMVRKTTIRPALYGAPVRLLVRALRLAGASDMEIVGAPIFRLLALEGPEIIDAFGELNRQGALRFRMQGDIIELNIEGNR